MTGIDRIDRIDAGVVVVGAGPAGIAAAVAAAERGVRVVVLDRGLEPGGQIWRHRPGAKLPRTAAHWLARFERSGAQLAPRASVVDARVTESGVEIVADQGGSALRVRGTDLILATGARERFLPFPGWTLPGVLGVGGAQALLKSGASFAGQRVVIAGSGPLLLPVAASLSQGGARLLTVAEQASGAAVARFGASLWRAPGLIAQATRYRAQFAATRYRTGTWVTAAHGSDRLTGVTLTDGTHTWDEAADLLCTGYGLVPSTELARLLGCAIADGAATVDARQGTTVPRVYAVGEATGVGGAPLSIVEGTLAGLAVASPRALPASLTRQRATLRRAAARMHRTFAPRPELRTLASHDTIVCRCEDVRLGAVQSASCARQARLYTRAGMGPCQGRICGPALELLLGWDADSVRSPIEPTSISVLCADGSDATSASTSGHQESSSSSLTAGVR